MGALKNTHSLSFLSLRFLCSVVTQYWLSLNLVQIKFVSDFNSKIHREGFSDPRSPNFLIESSSEMKKAREYFSLRVQFFWWKINASFLKFLWGLELLISSTDLFFDSLKWTVIWRIFTWILSTRRMLCCDLKTLEILKKSVVDREMENMLIARKCAT